MGILAGSLISAVIGYVMLVIVTRKPADPSEAAEQPTGADPG